MINLKKVRFISGLKSVISVKYVDLLNDQVVEYTVFASNVTEFYRELEKLNRDINHLRLMSDPCFLDECATLYYSNAFGWKMSTIDMKTSEQVASFYHANPEIDELWALADHVENNLLIAV